MSAGSRPGPAQRRRPTADPARLVALDVLRAVDEDDAYANLVLPAMLSERGISGRDAAFATELAYGSLRMRGLLDEVIARCSDRPLDEMDPTVLRLLRVGTHQLLHMRVPPHAAVSSTVDVARSITGAGRASFVNAVLRRISEREPAQWLAMVTADVDATTPQGAAVAYSHPRWIVEALASALAADPVAGGPGPAELPTLLQVQNAPPDVSLAAWPGRSTTEELIAAGARPGRWSPYAVVAPAGEPGGLAAVRERRAGVQDEGSQLVALALATAPLEGPDRHWLDGCAGPGGKAALLASLATQRGADLTAVEIAAHRADLVRRVIGLGHRVFSGDMRHPEDIPGWPGHLMDRTLIDAPCTGLGALRRRPEARWRRSPADLAALAPLQRDLLAAAVRVTRVGGVIGYATCSPHLAETGFVVDDVIRRLATSGIEAERLDARTVTLGIDGLRDRDGLEQSLGAGPDLHLWPHRHGTDGMYLALLRRRS